MKKNTVAGLGIIGVQALALTACTQKPALKPNFVLIIADDVSQEDLGCYGNKQVKTPNIDRLAAEGIRFNNMFLTASSSSPSRNSIITGRYPHNTGGAELHTEPPDYMIAFPELLRGAGYYSVQAGKFHMGPFAMRAFDTINTVGRLNGDGGEELWVKCLENRPKDKPFFMWFAAMDAHRVWGPNEFSGTHDPAGLEPPFYLADGFRTKQDLAHYYDEIHRWDHYIGLVYKELEKQGVAESTVIIIMADNGRPFPHSKTRVNDRGLKTPFIVHWPEGLGVKNRESDALLSSIDIAPTILGLAGIDAPGSIQGVSFSKLLNNPTEDVRSYVFAEHNWHDYEAHERMVRSKDYLFILNSRPQYPQSGPLDAVGSPSYAELDSLRMTGSITAEQSDIFLSPRSPVELYECRTDPYQFRNLAGTAGFSQTENELRGVLLEWMKETGDNIPDSITKDWYQRAPGNIRTPFVNVRGEPVDKKFNASTINKRGPY